LIALPLLLALQAQVTADQTLHFGVTAAISAGGYFIGSELGEALPRFLLGGILGVGAAAGKELIDLEAGDPSAVDFVAGVAGTAAGLLLAWAIDRFFRDPVLPFWVAVSSENRSPSQAPR
jgi:hypothetical protein